MTVKVLDLFSGIGGFSLGLERTGGFETVGFVEINQFCQRALATHWPGVPIAADVTEREFKDGEADVITAGFPCQDVSYAGRGAGLAGERSGLFREVVRAIRLVRPKFAILENVAALLSRGLDTVLGDLAEIGHDAEWHCIPASAVGAPHRRDRVWIVAHPGSEQHEGHRAPISGPLAAELSRAASDAETMQRAAFVRREQDGNHARPGEMADASLELFDWSRQARSSGRREPSDGSWWASEPPVGRVAHGIPNRVAQLSGYGNAVVPQIPEIIGRAILAAYPEARLKSEATRSDTGNADCRDACLTHTYTGGEA